MTESETPRRVALVTGANQGVGRHSSSIIIASTMAFSAAPDAGYTGP